MAGDQCAACPLGYFCGAGAAAYLAPGTSEVIRLNEYIRPCPGGTFGAELGLSLPGCSGVCAAGYYCPQGSTSPTQVACGSPAHFCPAGSTEPLLVSVGFYSIGNSSSTMTGQSRCEPGNYCVDGDKTPCPAGVFGKEAGLSSSLCSGSCQEGFYCPVGSTSRTASVCPAGVFGAEAGLKTSLCSGYCLHPNYCPEGRALPISPDYLINY